MNGNEGQDGPAGYSVTGRVMVEYPTKLVPYLSGDTEIDRAGHGGQDDPAGYPVSGWESYQHPVTGHVTNLVSDLYGDTPDHAGHGGQDGRPDIRYPARILINIL